MPASHNNDDEDEEEDDPTHPARHYQHYHNGWMMMMMTMTMMMMMMVMVPMTRPTHPPHPAHMFHHFCLGRRLHCRHYSTIALFQFCTTACLTIFGLKFFHNSHYVKNIHWCHFPPNVVTVCSVMQTLSDRLTKNY